jgi:hypothetical protein
MMPRRLRGDDGSLLLAMLAVLVVTTLVIVTAATVIAGQQQTRFDKRFETALQVAEHGMDQMVALVAGAPGNATHALPPGRTPQGGRWSVTAVNDPLRRVWTVTACGWKDDSPLDAPPCNATPDPAKRTVQVEVKYPSAFSFAAFGKVAATLNGTNKIDSFRSTGNTPVPICVFGTSTPVADPAAASATDVWPCTGRTGVGSVGTNGKLFVKGTVAADVDRMNIYNAMAPNVTDPLPTAEGECVGAAVTCGMTSKLFYERDPAPFPDTKVCEADGVAPPAYTGQINPLRNRLYRFTDVTLSTLTRFEGTVGDATIICMTGTLTIDNNQLINFSQPSGSTPARPRPPGTLFIINTGTSAANINIGNHTSMSASLLAPSALISLGASGNFYGSMVANEISSTGNFRFHYDETLADSLLAAPVKVSNWYEIR